MMLESFTLVLGCTGLEIAALVAVVGGTVAGTVSQQVAAGQAEEAEQARRQQIQLRERRERARAIREQQVQRARIRSAGVAAGVTPGTATTLEGGISDTASQLNRNLGFLRTSTSLSLRGSEALSRSRRSEALARTFGEVAELGAFVGANSPRIQRLFS